ncbi:MAG: hypothetical protein RLZZ628_334 [Bacteroidota bacterium]|jgi:hypothetical protein
MVFRFQDDYDTLAEPCPPKHYQPHNRGEVYRWTFEAIDDSRNFQSQYHKNPKRFQQKSDIIKCQALGLSCFDNLEGAKERFFELLDDIGEKVYQMVGNKIAKGSLLKADGVCGKVERLGHFTYHPAKEVELIARFTILESEKL